MRAEDWASFVDEQLPALIEHFDAQFSSLAADLREIKQAQNTLREQINSVNARIDTTNHQLTLVRDRGMETLEQARKTNGDVLALREWRARLEGVREGAGGTGHIIAATIGVLVGVAGVVIGILGVTQ